MTPPVTSTATGHNPKSPSQVRTATFRYMSVRTRRQPRIILHRIPAQQEWRPATMLGRRWQQATQHRLPVPQKAGQERRAEDLAQGGEADRSARRRRCGVAVWPSSRRAPSARSSVATWRPTVASLSPGPARPPHGRASRRRRPRGARGHDPSPSEASLPKRPAIAASSHGRRPRTAVSAWAGQGIRLAQPAIRPAIRAWYSSMIVLPSTISPVAIAPSTA